MPADLCLAVFSNSVFFDSSLFQFCGAYPMADQTPRKFEATCEFECGRCEKTSSVRRILANQGDCRCTGRKWTLHIELKDVDQASKAALLNTASLAAALATGVHLPKANEGSMRCIIGDVSSSQVVDLCNSANLSQRLVELVSFVQEEERRAARKTLHDRGAKPCRTCGMLTVPTVEKPWTYAATCSKSCCVKAYNVTTYGEIEADILELLPKADTDSKADGASRPAKKSIEIHCVCGETFTAAKMFVGTNRPCPHCGAKMLVQP